VHQSRDRALRRHVNNDERVLRAFEENPQNSIRRVSHALGVPQTSVHRVLQENGLHSFYFQCVQQLLARNEIQRIYFCEDTFISLFQFFFDIWRF